MQARHAQDDHARLPADRPGEGSEPVERGVPAPASAAVAVALEEPRAAADAPAADRASTVPPAQPGRLPVTSTRPEADPPDADRREAADPTAVVWSRRLFLNMDLVVLVPAVLVALALGAPTLGVLVGVGGWLLQRAVEVVDRRIIVRAAEPGSRLGLNFIDAFARVWLLAGAIIVAGVAGEHRDGLAAALVIFATYSISFAVRIARGRAGGPA